MLFSLPGRARARKRQQQRRGGDRSLESHEAERGPEYPARGENGSFGGLKFYQFMGRRADDDDGGGDVTEICEKAVRKEERKGMVKRSLLSE